MSSVQFSSPFSMMQASRALLVSGHAQQALHLGFFSSVDFSASVCTVSAAPSGMLMLWDSLGFDYAYKENLNEGNKGTFHKTPLLLGFAFLLNFLETLFYLLCEILAKLLQALACF